VTTADPTPVSEATRFFHELPEQAIRPAAVVFNRVLPREWAEERPDAGKADPLSANLLRWIAEAQRQTDVRREFAAQHGITPAIVPWAPAAPTTPDRLADLLASSSGIDGPALFG
jgi:anion-transporting  ArsA/GET3 family ATPase